MIPNACESGIMDLQGQGGGDGSCAIAAHNFIACVADSALKRWTSPSSREVRDQLLRELCIYHEVASEVSGVCHLIVQVNVNVLTFIL